MSADTLSGVAARHLEPFDSNVELIVVYLERVQLYFEAHCIKAKKQVPVFLNIIGRDALLSNLSSLKKPAWKLLKDHVEETFQAQESRHCISFSISSVAAVAWGDSSNVSG